MALVNFGRLDEVVEGAGVEVGAVGGEVGVEMEVGVGEGLMVSFVGDGSLLSQRKARAMLIRRRFIVRMPSQSCPFGDDVIS